MHKFTQLPVLWEPRSKQTQAEDVKLKRIQKELQTLDDIVSNDIGILRGVIEQAGWDYNTARKRYEKAEAEYNELRKAHKLEELLQQLHLQATEEEQEEDRKRGEKLEKEK
ncbi:unnamed protein product [Coregonus sp. 'balchen']|nr:unnamed protein product [Coregonus sp. 'balchen']